MPKFQENEEQSVVFNEKQIAEFEFCFKKIDKNSNGFVPIRDVGNLLRATGLNPSLKKISEITSWLESNSKQKFYITRIQNYK